MTENGKLALNGKTELADVVAALAAGRGVYWPDPEGGKIVDGQPGVLCWLRSVRVDLGQLFALRAALGVGDGDIVGIAQRQSELIAAEAAATAGRAKGSAGIGSKGKLYLAGGKYRLGGASGHWSGPQAVRVLSAAPEAYAALREAVGANAATKMPTVEPRDAKARVGKRKGETITTYAVLLGSLVIAAPAARPSEEQMRKMRDSFLADLQQFERVAEAVKGVGADFSKPAAGAAAEEAEEAEA